MADDLELRSEEVQELLGTPPPLLVRWGLLFVLILLIVVVWLLYWLPYPETVDTTIRIKREIPAEEVIAPEGGTISNILVKSEDTVEASQTLLVFESLAEFSDVHILDDLLDDVPINQDSVLLNFSIPSDLILGALKTEVYRFNERQQEARNLREGRISQMSIDEIEQEIRQEERAIRQENRTKDVTLEALKLREDELRRLRNLDQQGLLGDYSRVRSAERLKLEAERSLQDINTSIKARQSNIRLLRKQAERTETISQASASSATEAVRDAFDQLKTAVNQWRRNNLLVASIDGVVILDDVQPRQYVRAGERVAVVVPSSASSLIGKTELNLDESGQVEVGQKVVIDFYSFPAQQFGAVEGVVTFKSKIPTQEDKLPIEIRFPNGLVTSSGRSLEVGQDMAGDMSIIIQEKRLISWLLDRL
ncbi:MAG: HlyD family efflux transporter periplasmic adaptor subunit [Bacteroidota bacterium]